MKSDGWPVVRLGDFVEVKHGFAFKTKYASDEPSPYALFTRKNFATGGGFREDAPRYYHGEFADRFVLDAGDLMVVLTDLSKDGDLLGLPAIVPPTDGIRYLHNQRVGKVVLRDGGIELRFLYGVLRSPEYRRHVLNTASQTTVRDTAPSRLHDYRFGLPPAREQQRIGWVLGALDEKIESNDRLSGLLEETAATVFRARFLAPATAMGVGSRDVSLSTLAQMIQRGRAPKYCDDGGILVVNQKCIRDGRIDFSKARRHDANVRPVDSARSLRIGDVLVNSTGVGTLGRVAAVRWLPEPTTVDSHVTIVRVDDTEASKWFLAFLLAANQPNIEGLAEGSTGQTELSRGRLAELRLSVPSVEDQRQFDDLADPLMAKVVACERESITVAGVRDSLLPKLISGKIRVPDTTDVDELIDPVADAIPAAS